MSRQFAVLGKPISHSKSPAIHKAAYRVMGLDWQYGRAEVTKGGLWSFIRGLEEVWDGFSVTMPLKEEAMRLCKTTDEFVKATGACNTLVRNDDGTWSGFNTDVFGIIMALQKGLQERPKRILILGSGATATSMVVAVKYMNPEAEIKIYARNAKTRNALIKKAKSLGLKAKRAWFLTEATTWADLTVSTLPAGSLDEFAEATEAKSSWKPGGAFFDVSYAVWPSRSAQLWMSRDELAISGIEMLKWQAIAQLRIFLTRNPNQELPNEVAVFEAMTAATQVEH